MLGEPSPRRSGSPEYFVGPRVDPLSARYLEGTRIDYVMGAQGAGFKFDNPKAVGSCGCGSSFAI